MDSIACLPERAERGADLFAFGMLQERGRPQRDDDLRPGDRYARSSGWPFVGETQSVLPSSSMTAMAVLRRLSFSSRRAVASRRLPRFGASWIACECRPAATCREMMSRPATRSSYRQEQASTPPTISHSLCWRGFGGGSVAGFVACGLLIVRRSRTALRRISLTVSLRHLKRHDQRRSPACFDRLLPPIIRDIDETDASASRSVQRSGRSTNDFVRSPNP